MGEPEGLEEADQAPEGALASESRPFPSRKGCKELQKRETRNQGRGLSLPQWAVCPWQGTYPLWVPVSL